MKEFDKKDYEKFVKSRYPNSSAIREMVEKPMMGYISPSIIEEREMHVAQMDVFSRLMMERTMFFGTDFNSDSCNIAIGQLLYLASVSDEDIKMYINSPGGVVYDGYGLLDTMAFIKPDVATVCTGLAASMGSLLLMCGTRGKRSALPLSRVMVHQPLGGARGQATDILIEAEEIKKLRDEIYGLISQRTKQPLDKIAADCERDHWLTAQEALEYGIIDHIVPVTRD